MLAKTNRTRRWACLLFLMHLIGWIPLAIEAVSSGDIISRGASSIDAMAGAYWWAAAFVLCVVSAGGAITLAVLDGNSSWVSRLIWPILIVVAMPLSVAAYLLHRLISDQPRSTTK